MSRAKRLLDLQKMDTKRDAAMARLKQVAVALRGDGGVERARESARSAEATLADLDKRIRRIDAERQSLREHIAAEEKKLYGGAAKSAKEVQGFDREVASLKRRLSQLDDEVLELMIARDESELELAEARRDLEDIAGRQSVSHASLTKEKAALSAAIRELDALRAAAVVLVPVADASLYERVRAAKGGRAVTALRGDECGTCGMQLPRQTRAQVDAADGLVHCTGCGRILAS